MNYENIYNNLITKAQGRAATKKEANLILGYSEAHHILPRCMGGTDDNSNIAHLTPEEHYVAHQLLVKLYPNHFGIINTINLMSSGKRKNNKIFGWLRRRASKALSEIQTGQTKETSERVANIVKSKTGRTKETHPYLAEVGRKVSIALKGRTKENNESVARMAETLTGRTKETHPGVAQMSEKQRERSKETCQGCVSQSEKLKGRTKETHTGVASQSEKMKGRNKFNNDGYKVSSEKQRKLNDDQEKLLYDMILEGFKYKEVQQFLKEGYNIEIAYSTIPRIFDRVKKEILNKENYNI